MVGFLQKETFQPQIYSYNKYFKVMDAMIILLWQ